MFIHELPLDIIVVGVIQEQKRKHCRPWNKRVEEVGRTELWFTQLRMDKSKKRQVVQKFPK